MKRGEGGSDFEIIGEISFIDAKRTTAAVIADDAIVWGPCVR